MSLWIVLSISLTSICAHFGDFALIEILFHFSNFLQRVRYCLATCNWSTYRIIQSTLLHTIIDKNSFCFTDHICRTNTTVCFSNCLYSWSQSYWFTQFFTSSSSTSMSGACTHQASIFPALVPLFHNLAFYFLLLLSIQTLSLLPLLAESEMSFK